MQSHGLGGGRAVAKDMVEALLDADRKITVRTFGNFNYGRASMPAATAKAQTRGMGSLC